MASARALALRLLGRRDYTTAELRKKLTDREIDAQEIDAALESLAADGALDDRRAAATHIRVATRAKSRGRLRIQQELQARGVDRALIHELLASLPAADEAENVHQFLCRRNIPAQLNMADRRRVFQQLLRRGFTADVIAKALKTREDE